jgi:PEP-CTERM motif-containing protein
MNHAAAAPSLLRSTIAIAAIVLGVASTSGATIIGGGPPGPGLGGDDGSEIYVANLNPNFNRHIVLVKEAFDALPGSISHEWGMYFASDPSTLYPVLTTGDSGPPEQQAVIDFDNGQIVDLDSLSIESTFTPSLDPFGFYIKVEFNPGSPVIAFSQAALNPGGVDWYASFPFLAQPLFREVAFEVREQLYSLEIVDGALNTPEPTTLLLVGGGIALLAARRRD